jgi:hypothetical protein
VVSPLTDGVRRVALSADARCLSFGQFLELGFSAPYLTLWGHVRAPPVARCPAEFVLDRKVCYVMEVDCATPYLRWFGLNVLLFAVLFWVISSTLSIIDECAAECAAGSVKQEVHKLFSDPSNITKIRSTHSSQFEQATPLLKHCKNRQS